MGPSALGGIQAVEVRTVSITDYYGAIFDLQVLGLLSELEVVRLFEDDPPIGHMQVVSTIAMLARAPRMGNLLVAHCAGALAHGGAVYRVLIGSVEFYDDVLTALWAAHKISYWARDVLERGSRDAEHEQAVLAAFRLTATEGPLLGAGRG